MARKEEFVGDLHKIEQFLKGMEGEWTKAQSRWPLRRAFRQTLRPHVAPVRARAPKLSGDLKRSTFIRVRTVRGGEIAGGIGFKYKGTRTNPRWCQIKGSEYGNVHYPNPARTLTRYWASNRDRMIDEFKDNLADEVDKQIDQLAVKNGIRRG